MASQRWRAAMEYYVGLDVSLKQTSICVLDQSGSVVREDVLNSPRAWRLLLSTWKTYETAVRLEPTGWFISWQRPSGLFGSLQINNEASRPSLPVADAMPIRSARDTSSARDRTCIFSITLWRWALMVRSVQPNARATCLLVLPRMTRSKTCRSRGVNRRIGRERMSSLLFRLAPLHDAQKPVQLREEGRRTIRA